MILFEVYTRRGCHLCEELFERLEPLCRGRARVVARDVDTDPDWRERFGTRVPVVVCNGEEVCEAFLDEAAVRRVLVAADASGA